MQDSTLFLDRLLKHCKALPTMDWYIHPEHRAGSHLFCRNYFLKYHISIQQAVGQQQEK